MSIIEKILIAIALAMDSFAVSIGTGLALGRVSTRQTLRMAWHFGIFQAFMPVLGWFMGLKVRPYIQAFDHWLAFTLLAYLGLKMVWDSFQGREKDKGTDPTRGGTLILLAVATSIDALAVGLSLSLLGLDIWSMALIIGLVTFAFTVCGLHLGSLACRGSQISMYAELIGGAVLICIGIKILLVHGAFGL
jgi:putative Mn2+ efflux pump MntP